MTRCHICQSTCYRPVITRNAFGQMLPNGRYQCVKCKFEFSSVGVWRGDENHPSDALMPATGISISKSAFSAFDRLTSNLLSHSFSWHPYR